MSTESQCMGWEFQEQAFGPFFFEGTLTGQRYLVMLQKIFGDAPKRTSTMPCSNMMDDGAPHYNSREVRDYLNIVFPGRGIGRKSPIEWPPRSPVQTPLDFFFLLWGHLKTVVFKTKPRDKISHHIGMPKTHSSATV